LLPDSNNKLTVKWKGPFKVVEKKGPVNYKIEIKEGLHHINMLKEYIRREPDWWKVDKEVAVVRVDDGEKSQQSFGVADGDMDWCS